MQELCNRTLNRLPPEILVPGYDRNHVTPGIVHIGVGNFHRTHQAVFIDRCLHLADHQRWGIVGVGLGKGAAALEKADAFQRQDGLYTVTEYDSDGRGHTRVIGAMIEYLHAPRDPNRVLAVLSAPEIRIVTLTVTEGGYNIDERTDRFRLDDPEVARDLTEKVPQTVFGFLVEALARRRAAGTSAFAIVSCDNLRHNGDTTRKAIVSFAAARDLNLAAWIEREVAFPNSVVDRIAPSVKPHDRKRLNERSGIEDRMPAIGESFIQWVIEDIFPNGRPDLAEVGVQLRSDVALFEAVKGRMLNASHMMLAYPSVLCGYRLVHEAMQDERLRGFLRRFLERDAIPLVEGPPAVSLSDYKEVILERFSNPAVGDQLLRIAQDGAAKIPVFHRKTIERLLEAEGHLSREAFFLACFARYLQGHDDAGEAYDVVEPTFSAADWVELRSEDGLGLLRTSAFITLRLDHHAGFVSAYRTAASAIAQRGVGGALDEDHGHDW